MNTVLWGGRKGDLHYPSREFWRRNIPIDPKVAHLTLASVAYMDVGMVIDITTDGRSRQIVGIEGLVLGVGVL